VPPVLKPRPGEPPAHPAAPGQARVAAIIHSDKEIELASAWGRVDPDGTVYVREGESERAVGQFPGVPAAEALALYARRFLDLEAQVDLFAARLEQMTQKDIDQTISSLKQALAQPAAVGDLAGLRERYRAAKADALAVRQAIEAERAAAKVRALEERRALVEEAEGMVEQPAESINWKSAQNRLRDILQVWQDAQRTGPRIDRTTEDELWRRFSHARTSFDRKRRAHFAELEKRQGATKIVKEQIVLEAEKLATSQDWATTRQQFRSLMDRWRVAGRLSRREDDALWERFRAAQDRFFAARDSHFAANDAERQSNLKAKLAILEEAERLLPLTDIKTAQTQLRDLADRWDRIGHVPRKDMETLEARMKAIEDTVRSAEERSWRRSNPETIARVSSMTSQLEALIAGLEKKLAKVRQTDDPTAIAALEEDIRQRRAMLERLRDSAERGWE
jgi:hypothetical protein